MYFLYVSWKKRSVLVGVVAISVGGAYYFKFWLFASREPRQAIEIENGEVDGGQ